MGKTSQVFKINTEIHQLKKPKKAFKTIGYLNLRPHKEEIYNIPTNMSG